MTNKVWLTYAWADNEEGDFAYLVQELDRAGISAIYDKIAIIPGRKLWPQIADNISNEEISAWAYLITPNSLSSAACQEELAYALQRALETCGEEYPLIGLLHNVSIREVPMPIRVRLCVDLANPDWIEEIRAALSGAPPRREVPEKNPLIIKIHTDYLGRAGNNAIEIRPRFGELRYWRLAFPSKGPQPVNWGLGPANGGGIAGVRMETMEGEFKDVGGISMKFVGAGSPLTPSTSAYAVFESELPDKVFFGIAQEPFGTNVKGNIISLKQ